jgi:hypothetical protein
MPPATPEQATGDDEDTQLSLTVPDRRTSRREFDHAMRVANSGHRLGYDRALSPQTLAFRSVSAVVVATVLLALFLPAADPLRSSVYYATEGLFRSTYVEVPLRTLANLRSSEQSPYGPVGLASGRLQPPWLSEWSKPPAPAANYAPCQVPSGPATSYLFLGFGKPTTVDRFVIQAGLARTNPEWSEFDRPSVVDLLFSNNHCTRLVLADQFGPQQFDMHVEGVRNVTLRVVGTFRSYSGVSTGLTAISAVTFMTRR